MWGQGRRRRKACLSPSITGDHRRTRGEENSQKVAAVVKLGQGGTTWAWLQVNGSVSARGYVCGVGGPYERQNNPTHLVLVTDTPRLCLLTGKNAWSPRLVQMINGDATAGLMRLPSRHPRHRAAPAQLPSVLSYDRR